MPPPGASLTIGRSQTADVTVLDPRIGLEEARIEHRPEGPVIARVGKGQAFVNGEPVRTAPLHEGDRLDLGATTFHVDSASLVPTDPGSVGLEAEGLSVVVGGGQILLDDVSLDVPPSSFVAIVGPSGSGKSTLLNALSGVRRATSGAVRFGTLDVYRFPALMAHRLGWVPQGDIVNPFLTVRQELAFAAELRFGPAFDPAQTSALITEMLADLSMSDRADTRIGSLSGGQRKRVSVAEELLTEPALLFLDEPTSGLDPGNEELLMQLLHELAQGGRIVVTVTHATQSLALCDRVAFLAKGGRLAYYGPPSEALRYFEDTCDARDLAEVFSALDSSESVDWKAAYRASPTGHRLITEALSDRDADPPPIASAATKEWRSQVSALVRRDIAVLRGDRTTLIWMLLQAPILGLLFMMALGENAFDPGNVRQSARAIAVCWLLAIGATWIGAFTTIRVVVKDLPLFRRERMVGVNPAAVIASKAIVFGGITVVLCVVFGLLALARQQFPPIDAAGYGLPTGGVALGPQRLEVLFAAVVCGLAAAAIGLLVSAVVRTSDKATMLLLVVIAVQVALSIPSMSSGTALSAVGNLTSSAKWGTSAVASTVSLNNFLTPTRAYDLFEAVINGTDPPPPDGRWEHTAGAWFADILVLMLFGSVALVVAPRALRLAASRWG